MSKPLSKNIAWQYALQIARYLFPFITLPYLTRIFGPETYAVRAYILAFMTFMQIFLDYGFTAYGTRVIARNDSSRHVIQTTMSSITALRFILLILGAIFTFLLTPHIPIMNENQLYVAIAYAYICFKAILPDFVFQGLQDMGIITRRFVVSQTVAVILILILVKNPDHLILVPTIEALSSFIAFIWSWADIIIARKLRFLRVHKSQLLEAFRDSTVFFISYASTAIFTTLTTIMIGAVITDSAQVSYWTLAMGAVTAIQSLYSPISNSLYPHMVKNRDFKLLKKFLLYGSVLTTIGALLFACLSDLVMLILGGAEYLSGSYVVKLVAPVLLFSYPAVLLGFPVLAALDKTAELTTTSVIAAGFHIIGLLSLYFLGSFTIRNIALLRCATEAVLFISRAIIVTLLKRKTTISH